jgi:hypothetical protein
MPTIRDQSAFIIKEQIKTTVVCGRKCKKKQQLPFTVKKLCFEK